MSRIFEFQADRYAREHQMEKHLIDGLLKLNKENASTLLNDPMYLCSLVTLHGISPIPEP